MSVSALSAANAYAATLGRAKIAPKGAEGETPSIAGAKGSSFGDLVKQAATDLTATTKTAEKMSLAGISRQAELVDVVTAVTNAEMTLETVVAVRDKVISAYQEIMRMSI
jgi:flagellar hook-basal body complex protein FliE